IEGEPVRGTHAPAGVRWVRMATDLPTITREIRRGQLTPQAYLRSLRGPLEFAIFAADDPLPALLEAPLLASLAWRRKSKQQHEAPARQDTTIAIRNSR